MGLLHLLGRRTWRMREFADLVWLSCEARVQGIARDLQSRWHTASVHLVVAWFESTLNAVEDRLAAESFPLEPLGGPIPVADCESLLSRRETPRVITLLADWLPDLSPADLPVELQETAISVTLAERHFLARYDDQLGDYFARLPCRCALQCHVSLTEPLLADFAGPLTRQTLRSLGLAEDEALRMRSLSRRVRHAQRHFARQFVSSVPAAVGRDEDVSFARRMHGSCAASPQSWLESHCPAGPLPAY